MATEPVENKPNIQTHDLEEIKSKATGLQSRQTTTHELLIMANLKASVAALPLRKLQLITDSAWMLPREILSDYIDYQKLETIRAIAECFLNGEELSARGETIISLQWPFDYTKENYEKFIRPWLGSSLPISPEEIDDSEFNRMIQSRGRDAGESWEVLFWALDNITVGYFRHILGRFLMWAVPFSNEVAATVAVSLSPQSQKMFEKVMLGL